MIKTQIKDSLFFITLNRPEKRNALNLEILSLLKDSINQASQCTDIRMLVLNGSGNVFCAGADLDFIRQIGNHKIASEFANMLSSVLEDIRRFPFPVMTIIHGACMGGANGIVAASDIAIAEINTRFAFSEAKLGLVPAIISPYVLSKLPLSKAFDLLLTGRIFDATEAEHNGLITHTGTEGEMDLLFKDTVNQILSSAPSAIKSTRKLIWDHILQNNWDDYLKQSCNLFTEMASSQEAMEGINAFFEKRNPNWINGNNRNYNS